MHPNLIQKVQYYFNNRTFNHVIYRNAHFLVSQTGNPQIVIYCKRSDISGKRLFWGVQQKRFQSPINQSMITHVLFYSQRKKIFFIFDKIFIQNMFTTQSFQHLHNGSTIPYQFKYNAKPINNYIWEFEFTGTNVKIELAPFKY